MTQSTALSKKEFNDIMREITASHRFGEWIEKKDRKKINRFIKYVRPNWDMRDLECFYVDFDNIRFDSRQSNRPMFERIMEWLNGSDEVEYEELTRG